MGDAPNREPHFRFAFVEMLFALTVAEIAIQTAELVDKGPTIPTSLPAYSHLLLALVVVSTSWVGWTLSRAPGGRKDVRGIFDITFVVLLIDVLLVILYFILVKSVGIEKTAYGPLIVRPSTNAEAVWMVMIFAGYFLWDVVTKALTPAEGDSTPVLERLFGRQLWKRGWISAVCLLLAILAWSLLHSEMNIDRAVSFDLSLIALVLLFRALKEARKAWLPIAFSVVFVVSLIRAVN